MAQQDTDLEILDKLIIASGGVRAFAEAMAVSRQSIWEWRDHLSDTARLRMYLHAEKIGFKLPKDFLKRALP